MRLFGVLPVLSLLLGVRAYSHEPVPHRLDVRATCDLCATVSTVVGLPGSQVGEPTFKALKVHGRVFLCS
jgi:hypothetical protein